MQIEQRSDLGEIDEAWEPGDNWAYGGFASPHFTDDDDDGDGEGYGDASGGGDAWRSRVGDGPWS